MCASIWMLVFLTGGGLGGLPQGIFCDFKALSTASLKAEPTAKGSFVFNAALTEESSNTKKLTLLIN